MSPGTSELPPVQAWSAGEQDHLAESQWRPVPWWSRRGRAGGAERKGRVGWSAVPRPEPRAAAPGWPWRSSRQATVHPVLHTPHRPSCSQGSPGWTASPPCSHTQGLLSPSLLPDPSAPTPCPPLPVCCPPHRPWALQCPPSTPAAPVRCLFTRPPPAVPSHLQEAPPPVPGAMSRSMVRAPLAPPLISVC